MREIKEWLQIVGSVCLIFVGLWLGVAVPVFALRHPWMTDVERVFHLPTAIVFGTVPKPPAAPVTPGPGE